MASEKRAGPDGALNGNEALPWVCKAYCISLDCALYTWKLLIFGSWGLELAATVRATLALRDFWPLAPMIDALKIESIFWAFISPSVYS